MSNESFARDMTARDHIATQALAGMLANPSEAVVHGTAKEFANWAYDYADALIEQSLSMKCVDSD